MRSRAGAGLGVAFLVAGLSSAHAQAPAAAAPATAGRATPAATAPPPSSGATGTAETPAAGGGAPASTKPPSATGGYSWKDPPARRARRKKRDPAAPLAMFPAFRLVGKTSQLRVALTKPVKVEVRRAAGRIVYLFPGADVAVRNDTNALVVTHFETPLSRFRLVPVKEGVQLVLELREAVEPTHKLVEGPRGSATLIIELPAPQRSWTAEVEPPTDGEARLDRPRRPKRARGTLVTPQAPPGPRP